MASLAYSSLLFKATPPPPSSSCTCTSSCSTSRRTTVALHLPEFPKAQSTTKLVQDLNTRNMGRVQRRELLNLSDDMAVVIGEPLESSSSDATLGRSSHEQQMYLILETVADRVGMHRNIGEQRDNWNTLLLNSINMMTLTATTMAGLGVAAGAGAPLTLKVSSTILFTAATGMLLVMNKIQPSQLAEEQRNAVRLFKQLESEIRSRLAIRVTTRADVEEVMERVLALDRAFPLPLLGAMIEKFPKRFESVTWWPKQNASPKNDRRMVNHFPSSGARASLDRRTSTGRKNGWTEELEVEMRAIVDVLKTKDEEDYLRLGNIALKANKVLAVSGPVLSGLAAVASAVDGPSCMGAAAATVAVAAGSLAAAVNAFEHGGQVGMVVEMYRNCAGCFKLLEESIENTLEERDVAMRENGELFEMNVALKLGRSLSQLRDLARKSIYSDLEGTEIDEFGSKLF